MARKRKKQAKGVSFLEMAVIIIVVLVLFIFLIKQSRSMEKLNNGYVQKIENLQKEIEKEKEREEELVELESDVQTQEYAEKIAKERLGLVGKDEILFRPEN